MALIQRANGRRSAQDADGRNIASWQRMMATPRVFTQPPSEVPDSTDQWYFLAKVKYLKKFDDVEYRITIYGSRTSKVSDFSAVLGGWFEVKRIPPNEFEPDDEYGFGPWVLSYRKGRGIWKPIHGPMRISHELHGFETPSEAALAAADHAATGACKRAFLWVGVPMWTDPWRKAHPTPQMRRKRLARVDW